MIFGEYQKVFLRKKSQKLKKQNSKLKSHSLQINMRKKKTYKRIHYDNSVLVRQKKRKMKSKMEISKNEYMLGRDRNLKGSVFEHLYEQRKLKEVKRLRLFQRIQKEECPFKPQRKDSLKSKFNQTDFLKRNNIFLKKKQRMAIKEEIKLQEEFFQPNLNKRNFENPRKNLHDDLYNYKEKENIRRQRLVHRYHVTFLFKLILGK